jgi:hypothetical protein
MTTAKQQRATERIRRWRHDPLAFVRELFHAEPDAWQADVLQLMAKPGRKHIAMKSCAGPGKTAVLAWAGWHRLVCFCTLKEHPKGSAVSITSDNLRDNLWSELARWQNESRFLLQTFQWNKERVTAIDHPETFFLAAKGWNKTADLETIGRTLSGMHSRFPFYLIDESGDIPPNMLRSAEQGLTSCEDGLIITAGNTTSQVGMLYEVCTNQRDHWDVVSITGDPDDPKRSPRVGLEWAKQQIALYGRENPWVMAYVLGQFPPGSINALLSVDEVEAAINRNAPIESFDWSEKRLGVDVARFGDDRTVIFPRQGICAFLPIVMRHQRGSSVSVDIANRVMNKKIEWNANSAPNALNSGPLITQEFFDDTVGWSHGAVDVLRASGHSPIAVQFDKPSSNPRYVNLRAEMWMKMAEWVKEHGCLPQLPEIISELTAPTYFFSNGKFQIEAKDQIKKRIGKSPDLADALALTFAIPDMPAGMRLPGINRTRQRQEYDPYAKILS